MKLEGRLGLGCSGGGRRRYWYASLGLACMALPIRNRLAVRIAGSHPADRGSIPRYGRCNMVFSLKWPTLRFLRLNLFAAMVFCSYSKHLGIS